MNQKLAARLAKKITGTTIVTLLSTAMEDNGVDVTESSFQKVYLFALSHLSDKSYDIIEKMLDERLLRQRW